MGKSITSNKKYPVYFDDMTSFLGYTRKSDALRTFEKNYHYHFDYIELKKSQIPEHNEVFYQEPVIEGKVENRGKNRKRHIFLTKLCFYSFAMDSQTVTAKKIRSQMIQVYNTYHDLLVQRMNKLMEKTKTEEENQLEALKLAKERSEENAKKLISN